MLHSFWFDQERLSRIKHLFTKPGGAGAEDRKVPSGFIYVIRNGLGWRDALSDYRPHKTLCNRWARWSQMGVFVHIPIELAAQGDAKGTLMIDEIHLKFHRTASRIGLKRGWQAHLIGRTLDGLNSKPHAVIHVVGRLIQLFLTRRNVSD